MERIRILGIETSCDETAAAVVENGTEVLSNVVSSQIKLHAPFGGVVPEIACRAHIQNLPYVVQKALDEARLALDQIEAVAVTHTPGLVGALLIGVNFAKGLSLANGLPLVAVHHLHAHVYSSVMEHRLSYPFICLVVSGGHTSLYLSEHPLHYQLLGTTTDDAAGEAFDKVASLLNLPYPGGPSIEKAARDGNPAAIPFPRTFLQDKERLAFSFSGIKTAVLYHTRGKNASRQAPLASGVSVPDVAASFQEAVVEVLVEKLILAAKKFRVKNIALGGGVACNGRLREKLTCRAREEDLQPYFPSPSFCTDNAAMIAGLGYHLFQKGVLADLTLDASATARRKVRSL